MPDIKELETFLEQERQLGAGKKTESDVLFQKRIRENKIFDTRNIKSYPQLVKQMNIAFSRVKNQPSQKQLNLASEELKIKPTRYVKTYGEKRYGTQTIRYKDKDVHIVSQSVKGKRKKVKRDIKTGRFVKWGD